MSRVRRKDHARRPMLFGSRLVPRAGLPNVPPVRAPRVDARPEWRRRMVTVPKWRGGRRIPRKLKKRVWRDGVLHLNFIQWKFPNAHLGTFTFTPTEVLFDPPDYETEDFCVACGAGGPIDDFATCDGCGNAVCNGCADEDDFGNVQCDPECGLP